MHLLACPIKDQLSNYSSTVYPRIHASLDPSIPRSIHPSIHLTVHFQTSSPILTSQSSIHPSIYPIIQQLSNYQLSVYPFIHWGSHPSIHCVAQSHISYQINIHLPIPHIYWCLWLGHKPWLNKYWCLYLSSHIPACALSAVELLGVIFRRRLLKRNTSREYIYCSVSHNYKNNDLHDVLMSMWTVQGGDNDS